MSGMMNKVKDALKSDRDSSGQDAYDTTSSGQHGQSGSMPGAFDSGAGGASDPRHTSSKGYGTAHSTDQRHVQSSGVGHEAAYQQASGGSGHGTSKYAAEPTQSSYTHDRGPSGAHQGAGYGTAGAGTTGAGGLGHHSSRKEVPDTNLMDPADRERGSNVMDRSRADYAGGADDLGRSGSNKLHKRDDPRSNYDNSSRSARADQEAALRREQGTGTTRQTGYGDTTSGTTHQSGYGDTTSGSRYDQSQGTTGSSGEPIHNSKLMNKLDPRVDNSNIQDKESSKYQDKDRDSGYGGGASGGAGAAAATAAATHSGRDKRTDRSDYGTQSSTTGNTYTHGARDTQGTHGTSRDTYGTTSSALPTRTRDEYGTGATGTERGDFSRDPRHGEYSSHGGGAGTTAAAAAPLASSGRHVHGHQSMKQEEQRRGSSPVPYSMSGAHTLDPATQAISGLRRHFHCMGCGHKNDAGHLRDAQGQQVQGRNELHCMNCGHRNQVGHMIK